MMSVLEIPVCKEHTKLTSLNTKLKCAKIIQKWDTVHIEISANLHMEKKNFTKLGHSQKKHTGLKNANLSGNKVHAVTVSDVSFFIMSIKHAPIVISYTRLHFS